MSWTDKDEAKKVRKFLKCGLLYPEDLKANELRVLKKHRPKTFAYVKFWLEFRNEQIEAGEWSEEADPPNTDRRINRLDNGNSVADPYND